jgi:hypothetical protein
MSGMSMIGEKRNEAHDNRLVACILQRLTQFGGVEKYKDELKAVLSGE